MRGKVEFGLFASSVLVISHHSSNCCRQKTVNFCKRKQPAKASKAKSITVLAEVAMTKAEQLTLATKKACSKLISPKLVKSSDEDDDDDVDEGSDDQDEGNNDAQDSDEEGEEFIYPNLSIHDEEETKDEESFDPITKTHEHSDDEGNDDENLGLNVGSEEGQDAKDDEEELYRDFNINLEGRVIQMADVHTTQEFKDTHELILFSRQHPRWMFRLQLQWSPTLTPSTIATISTVPQAPTPPTTAPSNLLHDLLNFGSLFKFDHRLKTLEANFSEFVQTNQFAGAVSSIPGIVKVQVSKILPKIEKTVNEQLEAKVHTQLSNSSKTSYAVAADLSEMELKKILIEKMKGNKCIYRSDEQRNLYKAPVKAYESDKIILDTYGDIVTFKRRRDDDADKDEEPSVGSDRGSKRRRKGKEPESKSAPKEKVTWTTGKSTQGLSNESTQSRHLDSGMLDGLTYELIKGSCKSLVELEFFLEEVYKATTDQLDWNNPKGQQYPHNLLKPVPLIPNFQGRCVISFYHFINNDFEYLCGGASSREYTTSITKTKAADYGHIKWIKDLVPRTMWSQESEGDFKRLRIQDIEDMLLLLVQGKLKNLTVEERFAFNVSLRMFTRSIVIQRYVENLQIGVESYQKKLNLTSPDTYRSDLKHKEAYTAYSNPRGFIYQNKDKQNRLMRIDELHKFSDGMLNDVRTALDDRLKGIRMKCLPQTIWRKSDKERAAAMIQAIDKQLKTKRIMRSLEKLLAGDCTRETFGFYKGPYDLSYDVLII
nr:hypothetical protein [Tanacetum cinerariifolium]